MRPFENIRRLLAGLFFAAKLPEVQGVMLLTGSLIFTATLFYWIVEGWSLLDAAYFSIVTIATVGFGDFAPQTTLGKLFTMGYIICGLGIFVTAVSSLAAAALLHERPPKD